MYIKAYQINYKGSQWLCLYGSWIITYTVYEFNSNSKVYLIHSNMYVKKIVCILW